jgi:hypothetical protein
MKLNVGDYLLGLGISSLVFTTTTIVLFIYAFIFKEGNFNNFDGFLFGLWITMTVLSVLFGTAWFIIGAVILFRGNIDCIRNASTHVIYALVIWCISAFQILQNCLNSRKQDD